MSADIQCTACGARFHNPLCPYCRDNTPPPDPDAFEAAKEADLREDECQRRMSSRLGISGPWDDIPH